jgi:hypothetical protein
MGKLLLNLTPGEPLTLVKRFPPCFDDSIELDFLLVGALYFGVHDPINCFLFNAVMTKFFRVQVSGRV